MACTFLLVNCWYKTANIAVQDRPVTVQQSAPTLTKDAAIKAANVIHDMTAGVLKKTMKEINDPG